MMKKTVDCAACTVREWWEACDPRAASSPAINAAGSFACRVELRESLRCVPRSCALAGRRSSCPTVPSSLARSLVVPPSPRLRLAVRCRQSPSICHVYASASAATDAAATDEISADEWNDRGGGGIGGCGGCWRLAFCCRICIRRRAYASPSPPPICPDHPSRTGKHQRL